jgi:hypothetical protein
MDKNTPRGFDCKDGGARGAGNMMRILLCCEGSTDQGRKEYIDGEYVQVDGVMQVLIEKVSGNRALVFVVRTRQEIKKYGKLRRRFAGKQAITSLRLHIAAKQEGCTHIAYHRDEDNNGFAEMYAQLQGYFTEAKAQQVKCLAIVPKPMTESWLLADKNAYRAIFEKEPSQPALPSKPEELWGKKGTDNHPKKYLERVLTQYQYHGSLPEIYTAIAKASDTEIVKERCPISFGQFCADMQGFLPKQNIHENLC